MCMLTNSRLWSRINNDLHARAVPLLFRCRKVQLVQKGRHQVAPTASSINQHICKRDSRYSLIIRAALHAQSCRDETASRVSSSRCLLAKKARHPRQTATSNKPSKLACGHVARSRHTRERGARSAIRIDRSVVDQSRSCRTSTGSAPSDQSSSQHSVRLGAVAVGRCLRPGCSW